MRERDRYILLTITSTDLDSAKLEALRAIKLINIFISIRLNFLTTQKSKQHNNKVFIYIPIELFNSRL